MCRSLWIPSLLSAAVYLISLTLDNISTKDVSLAVRVCERGRERRKKRETKKQCIWIEQCTNISKRPNFSTYFKCYLHFVSALTPQIKQKSNNCIRCTGKRLPLLLVSFFFLSLYAFMCRTFWLFGALNEREWSNGTCCEIWYFPNKSLPFLHSVCLVAIPCVRIVSNEFLVFEWIEFTFT